MFFILDNICTDLQLLLDNLPLPCSHSFLHFQLYHPFLHLSPLSLGGSHRLLLLVSLVFAASCVLPVSSFCSRGRMLPLFIYHHQLFFQMTDLYCQLGIFLEECFFRFLELRHRCLGPRGLDGSVVVLHKERDLFICPKEKC